jgi:hypothetical protein
LAFQAYLAVFALPYKVCISSTAALRMSLLRLMSANCHILAGQTCESV